MDVADLAADPLAQAQRWLDEAAAAGIIEPNAMSLATTDAADTGDVTVRTVLLRGIDHGFVFFTNYQSAKGRALDADRRAALSLTWPLLGRQIRAVGEAERVAEAESDAYFASRPRGSQLAAWASPQSEVLPDRAALDAAAAGVAARFEGVADIPRPPHWGGYRVVPHTIEFWLRGENRLHDRLRYRRSPQGAGWAVDRLAP